MFTRQQYSAGINYTMPFLWVNNNDYESVGREIEKIKESGSNAFCVESRIYEEFCGAEWWKLMDFIVGKAESLRMKVWLLDDKHFPTGGANGAVERNPQLRPKYIVSDEVDVRGPVRRGKVLLQTRPDARLYCAAVLRQTGNETFEYYKDVTDCVVDGSTLKVDLPQGYFRVCAVSVCTGYDESGVMIDMLSRASVRLLIDEVYEPHYARYKGTCFEGFFSDEPRFGNGVYNGALYRGGIYGGNAGEKGLAYNWAEDMGDCLARRAPGYERGHIVSLWNDVKGVSAGVRVAYMDEITRRYGENFSGQLSAWCRERGLQYASHIIEDSGAHTHTHYSAGHYFRSQQGADAAGIDVVLHQIKPYLGKYGHIYPPDGGFADPTFFDNTLAKLAVSCAHIDEKKENRALCEIFGAYGWAEDSFEMLWLANHMMVRGINRFIPHAFTTFYPCTDCPPHFYSAGENPLYPAYKKVIGYINEVCARFEGSRAEVRVAVLYHAEAEWSGKKFMSVDKVAGELLRRQIDFDIIPEDSLYSSEEGGSLQLNGNRYAVLIVPRREYLPEKLSRALETVSAGTEVLYAKESRLASLGKYLQGKGLASVDFMGQYPFIRARKARKGGKDIYMLHNEHPSAAVIRWKVAGCTAVKQIDILNEREELLPVQGGVCTLRMEAGQALLFELSAGGEAEEPRTYRKLALRNVRAYCYEREGAPKEELLPGDLNDLFASRPHFSGFAEVEADVDLTGCDALKVRFTGGFVCVEISGEERMRIFSPGIIRLDGKYGVCRVRFTLCNTLADRLRDGFSFYSVLAPVSLTAVWGG